MPPRVNKRFDFLELSEIPGGYPLPSYFSLVVPVRRDVTNLITNPSGETASTGWSDTGSVSGVSRQAEEQYSGAYSIRRAVDPTSGNPGIFFGSISLTASSTYIFSCYTLFKIAGVQFNIEVMSTANVVLAQRRYTSNGFWMRPWIPYKETSSTSRRIHIRPLRFPLSKTDFYVDAAQVEEIPSGELAFPTTYIDGDQTGFTPGEFPDPYYWNGTPHASSSTRSLFTRSGGKVMSLRDLGLTLAAVAGMGLVVPDHSSLSYGQLDGETYQFTQKQARVFSLAGRVTGRSAVQFDEIFSSLSTELDSDSSARREPLLMKYQPMDEDEEPVGPELDLVVTYNGGMEGQRDNLNGEVFTASFKQYFPMLLGHSEGVELSNSTTVSNANSAIRRKTDGNWASVSTGFSGGLARITALARHPDGTIYWGGDFTDAGGSGADYAAKYNPTTDVLSVVKSATAFNAAVEVIAVGPDGIVYFGGSFTNVDGNASSDGIVSYNPNTDTFSNLGTGVAAGGSVFAIAFDDSGNLYAGGSFTTMGGVANTANIARWTGSAWQAVGTGTNGLVRTIMTVRGTSELYLGGDFTLAGGVADTVRIARWTGSAYVPLETGANNAVRHIVRSPAGLIYVVGAFTTLGGRSIQYIGTWNGVTFQAVTSPTTFNDTIQGIAFKPNGSFYVVGEFGTVNGVTYPDAVAAFDGAGFTPVSIDLPGSSPVFDIIAPSDGSIYIGFNASGSASVEVVTNATHSGSGRAFPVIKMTGPSSGTARITSVRNLTTGRNLYFNLTLLTGEIAYLNLDPVNVSFVSQFRGDLSYTIMQGSDEADFFLTRGVNKIAVIDTGSPTLAMFWDQSFVSAADAVGVQ